MNGRNRNPNIACGNAGQIRVSSDKEEFEIARRKIKGQAQITEGRNYMGGIRIGVVRSRDGEIGVENLVYEGRVGELRWVAERERGHRGFDDIRVDVFGLITVFEHKVLEERVCGQRGREEVGREETGWVREDCGLGFREEEWVAPPSEGFFRRRRQRHGGWWRRKRRCWGFVVVGFVGFFELLGEYGFEFSKFFQHGEGGCY